MNGPQNKKRDIFDKIRSNFERKQLFEKLIQETGQLVCKGSGDSLFHFTPFEMKGIEGLYGLRVDVEGKVSNTDTIVANFRVGEDRYFMQTSLLTVGDREMVLIPDELFKLQRRIHNRVELDDKINRKINIIERNMKSVFVDADCLDISAGGARVVIYGDLLKVAANDRLRMNFHIKNKWSFEASGIVKHLVILDGNQVFGFEFDTSNKALANKLTMMMLELQRWYVLNVGK